MSSICRNVFLAALASLAIATGCSSQSLTSGDTGGNTSVYSHFLVIGVAGDYDSRAQFERATVAELRSKGASASAYHTIVKGNRPITPDEVHGAVTTADFDAVLVTRVLDTEVDLKVKQRREETDARPIGDRLVNLFRYNYTDYSNPGSIDVKTDVTFAVDLYSAATEEIVWSNEFSSGGETNLGLLIDKTAASVVKKLDRADLISP